MASINERMASVETEVKLMKESNAASHDILFKQVTKANKGIDEMVTVLRVREEERTKRNRHMRWIVATVMSIFGLLYAMKEDLLHLFKRIFTH